MPTASPSSASATTRSRDCSARRATRASSSRTSKGRCSDTTTSATCRIQPSPTSRQTCRAWRRSLSTSGATRGSSTSSMPTGDIYHDFEPVQHGSMMPARQLDGVRDGVLRCSRPTSSEGGMFDGWGRRVRAFPRGWPSRPGNAVLDLTGDCRDEIVVWDPYELWVYTQDDNPKPGGSTSRAGIPCTTARTTRRPSRCRAGRSSVGHRRAADRQYPHERHCRCRGPRVAGILDGGRAARVSCPEVTLYDRLRGFFEVCEILYSSSSRSVIS